MGFFPCCSICGKYSPFLIDEKVLASEKIRKTFRAIVGGKQIVLCPACLPNPQEFLTSDSLLRDGEFHGLLLGFEVSDLAEFRSLAIAEVVLIAKETRINVCFKQLARKPFPKAAKLRKLLKAFPRVHRMHFRDYGYEADWLRDLQQKCTEIKSFYLDARTLDLHDNFDLMVERTPLHERTSNRSRREYFSDDSLTMRLPPSLHSVSMNSLHSIAMSRIDSESDAISSQSVEDPRPISSESFNISSQSVEPNSEPLPPTRTAPIMPSLSSSQSSSGGESVLNMPSLVRNVREPIALSQSPQPGPSGLQQRSSFAVPTRRRTPEAVNPSSQNFRDVRVEGGRLPRVPGG